TGAGAMLSTNGKYLLNERDIQSTRPGSIKRRQARMPQGPWQDAPFAWVFETQRPPRVDRKAGLLIVAERARVIEAAGVHPEPVDRARPRPFDCGLQKERPELAADEFRDEAEIGQFRLTRIGRLQLEIASRHAADVKHEYLRRLLRDLYRKRLVVEQPTLVPQPR